MNPNARQKVDAALAAAVARVTERAERTLASPDVTTGRWYRELQAELADTNRRRALRLIVAWERHVTDFLRNIDFAVEVAFGDRDTSDLPDEPTDWRDRA